METLINSNPLNPALFTETAPCPICGKREFDEIRPPNYPASLSEQELLKVYHSSSEKSLMDPLTQCRECRLVQLSPRVKKEIALASYSNAEDATFIAQNEFRVATFKRSLDFVFKTTGLVISKDTRVLDVGCAGGAFPKAASDMGVSVIGVEPSRYLCEFGRKTYGLDLRSGTLEEQNFPDKQFDLVTLWDVLEHLYEPAQVLEECRRILKPSGFLVVNYPDHGSLLCRLMGKRWPFYLSVHLYYFTQKTLEHLLGKHGFTVSSSSAYWQTLELDYVLKRGADIIPAVGFLRPLFKMAGLSHVPFKYNMGQRLAIAKLR